MKASLFVIFLVFLCEFATADVGCQLSDGKIYSPQTGTALLGATLVPLNLGISVPLYNSPEVPTNAGTCPGWAGSIVPTGNACTTQVLNVAGLGLVAQNQGVEVSYIFVNCPLDDYSWAIVLASGTFGLVAIRRRIK